MKPNRQSESAAKKAKELRKKSRELDRLTFIFLEFHKAGIDPLKAIKLYCPTIQNSGKELKDLEPNLTVYEEAYAKWKAKSNLFNKSKAPK